MHAFIHFWHATTATTFGRFLFPIAALRSFTFFRSFIHSLIFACLVVLNLCVWQAFLLKQPDIDVKAKDDRGQTALDAARANQKDDVVRALQEFGG